MPRADIGSPDQLRWFRSRLVFFYEEARQAIDAARADLLRVRDGLAHEQAIDWQKQVAIRARAAEEARLALLDARHGHRLQRKPGCQEEEQALARARARLQEAQQKLSSLAHWRVVVEREGGSLLAAIKRLDHLLLTMGPVALARLDHMHENLKSYLLAEAAPVEPPSQTGTPSGEDPCPS